MRAKAFIEWLRDMVAVVGDVEVVIETTEDRFEPAAIEGQPVKPMANGTYRTTKTTNTETVIKVW